MRRRFLKIYQRSRLKEKVDAGRTNGRRTLRHGISSHGLRPGELKTKQKRNELLLHDHCLSIGVLYFSLKSNFSINVN